ncbi:DHA2 family efflux MFS transporter permease subunit [Sphingosinicella xenopeptidilytica]|uniref:DHA2 family efflux MFS transporter permease subunit n=1 Tax=Sphingosinicella xenopeptidilytica TaxID=364098 RepID=A0ABW3C477_SPHXN
MTESTDDTFAGFRIWAGFAMMCLGMFMAILDIQIVATSLPTIQAALHIGIDEMSWVQTAYLVAEIIAIPMTGLLTRAFSMRWLFVLAVAVFTVASAGCAASQSFPMLIGFRVLQGFAGGTLIPAVFSAVFLLFPARGQATATTIAGVVAVFAPTVGPIVGGWLTETYSWHWLFLINIVPGLLATVGAVYLLPRDRMALRHLRRLDIAALVTMAAALAALEIGLKEAPTRGWTSVPVASLLLIAALGSAVFVRKTLKSPEPVVALRIVRDRNFAIGCCLSFVLGIGLFGSVYLMPFFLGLVRGHGALEIGKITLVTGVAQLAAAPLAVALERRLDARLLSAFGFALFALGIGLSARQTTETDFAEMLVPQAIRGVAIMFCILPPTRMALGRLSPDLVADGSGLFNLMRNIGGAVGLALIDTVIFSRSPVHAASIVSALQAGNVDTARMLGIPVNLFLMQVGRPVSPETVAALRPMVERAALADAINDAWMLVALITVAALLLLPFARQAKSVLSNSRNERATLSHSEDG